MKRRLLKSKLLSSFKSYKFIMLGVLSIAFSIGSTSLANGDTVSATNAGDSFITIPDNDPGGVTSTVTITESEIIESASFSINGLQHSWIGDLIITVENLTSGVSATLVNRVGSTGTPFSRGFDTNVNGTYTFADGNGSLASAAALGDTNFEVPAITYDASGFLEAEVSLDSIFAGQNTFGQYQFTISDNASSDTGVFTGVTVDFETVPVPEPGTMATIVLGTLFGGIYVRRRHGKKKKDDQDSKPE